MKRKSRGQTLVEFAMIFPVLMVLLFAGIDFGYYIFGWSEVQFAARRGAEQASKMQPREILAPEGYQDPTYRKGDPCFMKIAEQAAKSGSFNIATTIEVPNIFVRYYSNASDASPDLDSKSQDQGRIIEVLINKELEPLTPLTDWILGGRNYKFNALSRRTIVANGPTFPSRGPNGEDYQRCVMAP